MMTQQIDLDRVAHDIVALLQRHGIDPFSVGIQAQIRRQDFEQTVFTGTQVSRYEDTPEHPFLGLSAVLSDQIPKVTLMLSLTRRIDEQGRYVDYDWDSQTGEVVL